MLDAYIIERIRRERERKGRDRAQIPLHIDDRRPPPREREEDPDKPTDDSGGRVIDFLV